MTVTDGGTDRDRAPRAARLLVGAALVGLLLPGVIGFEAWPLTAWRLFSLSRDADQTRWVLEAVDGDGGARAVSLEELPLGYRNAEWPMAELPGASGDRRDAVCRALTDAVLEVVPDMAELRIVRDRQTLVETAGGWEVRHGPEVEQVCAPGGKA